VALALAEQLAPRAIVVELEQRGVVDGFELLEQLRRSAAGREQNVIVWSGTDPTPEDRRRLKELASSVLLKEKGATSLLEELQRLVPARVSKPEAGCG
jgi:CheY-like chemotaxis protein